MTPRTRLLWLVPFLLPVAAGAQDAPQPSLAEAAEAAGWTLSTPSATDTAAAAAFRLQKDDLVVTAADLRSSGNEGVLVLEDVRITQTRPNSASGEVRAARLAVSELAGISLLSEPAALATLLCAEGAARPLALEAEALQLLADPDGMAQGQPMPETVGMERLTASAEARGGGESCTLQIGATGRGIHARAADGTRAEIDGFVLNGTGAPDAGVALDYSVALRGLRAQDGERLLMELEELALELESDGFAVPQEGQGWLAAVSGARGRLALTLSGLDMPMRDMLPADMDLPGSLGNGAEDRFFGDLTARLSFDAGAVDAHVESALAGLADFTLALQARLPQSAGGAELLPGVPSELAGLTLESARLAFRDRGANDIIDHFTGEGIPGHVDRLLDPAGRILSETAMSDLRGAVADWLAEGLSGGAHLAMEPAEPVSIAQAGSLLLFAPEGVPALLGLDISAE